jgi:hypothetical protein
MKPHRKHPDRDTGKKRARVDIRDAIIVLESFILFLLLFRNWDAVKAWITGLFS